MIELNKKFGENYIARIRRKERKETKTKILRKESVKMERRNIINYKVNILEIAMLMLMVFLIIPNTSFASSIITTQPNSVTVSENTETTFSVSATGSDLSYLWLYKQPVDNFEWTEIPSTLASGMDTNTLTIQSALLDYQGYAFRCLVSSSTNDEISNIAYLYVEKEGQVNTVEISESNAYAVYSADDNSLRFYKTTDTITEGSTYNGFTVTNVYTGFEEATYSSSSSVPWYDIRENVTSVVVENEIAPVSTAYWFYEFENTITIDVTKLNTSNVTDMSSMFSYCVKLSSIQVGNKFVVPSTCTDMFSSASSLSAIIIVDETPTAGAFTNAASQIGTIVFYVPNDAESAYETSWAADFTATQIEPILQTTKDDMIINVGDTYTDTTYITVAGFDESKASNYTAYGYNVSKSGNVDTTTPATYVRTYSLTRNYKSGDTTLTDDVATTTRNVVVEEVVDESTIFITEWTIPANNTQIILPVEGNGLDILVDWGDGSAKETVTTYMPTHTYASAGVYEISITGTCPSFGYPNNEVIDTSNPNYDNVKEYYTFTKYITGVLNWGEVSARRYSFSMCENLNYVSNVFTENTFTNVTGMEYLFYQCTSLQSVDLSGMNAPKLRNMISAFEGATNLKNVKLANITAPNLTYTRSMFKSCSNLVSVDLTNLNTANVTNMNSMFEKCSSLTALDVSSFDTTNVEYMYNLFNDCESLTSLDLSNFETPNLIDMEKMFEDCKSLVTLNLENFNTSQITNMAYLFNGCSSLKDIVLTSFDTSAVTSMNAMFQACSSLETLDLSSFDTSNVTNSSYMFASNESLKSILVSNKFVVPATCGNMFSNTADLKAIIIIDSIPVTGQFANAKDQLTEKIFYVPSKSAESAYEAVWAADFTAENIRPILELVGDSEIKLYKNEIYDEQFYTVAGFTVENSSYYDVYGYIASMQGDVDTSIVGTYEIIYDLVRNVNGIDLDIMDEIRTVIVETIPIKPPTDFIATQGASESIITVSWIGNYDADLKYELSARTGSGDWVILSNDAKSDYEHSGLLKNTIYEYRIRGYDAEGTYTTYVYTVGSTIIEPYEGEVVLDTIKPSVIFNSALPTKDYITSGDKVEIIFNVTDANYYDTYTTLTKDNIVIKVADETLATTDVSLEKTEIANGMQFKYIINALPYTSTIGELKIVIPEGMFKDKALNTNDETTLNTGKTVVNTNITTTAPTLELDTETNNVIVTCNQIVDYMPDKATILYEYREVGNEDFISGSSNILINLASEITYEVRTVLVDVTGKAVSSEISTITTVKLPAKVKIIVDSPESGTYIFGTQIKLIAQFNVGIDIVTLPVLKIKFGEGEAIELTGTFNSADRQIVYEYTTVYDDLGELTIDNFKGSVMYTGTQIDYDLVPEVEGSTIVARTGARLEDGGVQTYYPYVQDAIDAANANGTEATVVLLREEQLLGTIEIPNTKNILLDLNGSDIIINSGDATAIINNGTLKIIENVGTGEIKAEGATNVQTIVNNSDLTLVSGMIIARITGENGTATAIANYGNFVIGEDDGTISKDIPYVDSDEYGVQNLGVGSIHIYDGRIEGLRNKSYTGELIPPSGYNIITERIGTTRERTYISIDNMPPLLKYTILTPGWRNDYVEVEIEATDEDSGIRYVTVDGNEVVLTDSKGTVRLTENKEYILYAVDNASNSSVQSLTIRSIDKILPIFNGIIADKESGEISIEIVIEVQDLDSGLAGIILKEVDEVPTADDEWMEIEGGPTSKQFISMEIEKGKTYYCFAKDVAGNIAKYDGEIMFTIIDKYDPTIESVDIIEDEGKDYVSGKTVIVEVEAKDNIGVSEILISNVDLTEDEAKASSDWKEYNENIVHKLPVDGDGEYTIYVWVKDATGNISMRATASTELKAFVVGDNELDYEGTDTIYNKTSLRFLVKDYNFDFDNDLTADAIMLRLTSGDKVMRNISNGLTLNKLENYDGNQENDFNYLGEVYELKMENMPGTGNLSILLLSDNLTDLARNSTPDTVVLTDMYVDNTPAILTVTDTDIYDANGVEYRDIVVNDREGYRIDFIEVNAYGIIKTYALTNGEARIALPDGAIITAYDKAGNESIHEVGKTVVPILTATSYDEKLVYGGTSKTINYNYEGDGALEIFSSDTTIANVSIDATTKKITVSPVNAGFCEIVLRAVKTNNYVEAKITILIEVTPRPVTLEWSDSSLEYTGRLQDVTATVTDAILNDVVTVTSYRGNRQTNAGTYTAEALSVSNSNYTVEGGTNITHEWEITKLARILTLNVTDDQLPFVMKMPIEKVVGFEYTGESAEAFVTLSNPDILSHQVINYDGSGDIKLVTGDTIATVGTTTLTLTIPESTNYAEISTTLDIEVVKEVRVFFDVQGGDALNSRIYIYNRAYGTLPMPTKAGDEFSGWYTEPEGRGTLIETTTIVTNPDNHTLYACWNKPPEWGSVTRTGRTTSSITVQAIASDPDEDNIRYTFKLNGTTKHTTDYVTHNQAVSYTFTGLSEYTYYDITVVVDDEYEEITKTISERTLCSGTGYTDGSTCSGTEYEWGDCSECVDGVEEYTCSDGGEDITCSSCGGDGETSEDCDGPTTCSKCNNTGTCPGSPVEVDRITENPHSSCGKGSYYQAFYECKTCGITGDNEYCDYWQNNVACIQRGTNNHANAKCPSCNGNAGSTCSHGNSSSHTVTEDCSRCDGGTYDVTCSHGYKYSHTAERTCTSCDGDGERYEYRPPCDEHNYSYSHYYCDTHDYVGSTKSHCSHGRNSEH